MSAKLIRAVLAATLATILMFAAAWWALSDPAVREAIWNALK